MNNNTSATGGILVAEMPDPVALRRFFQGLIVGVTELPGTHVRPRWQRDPPPAPAIEVDWCAFGITQRKMLGYTHVTQRLNDAVVRYDETVIVLASFYGLGAEIRAEMLRDGMQIGQNREAIFLAGMAVRGFGDIIHVPELVKNQWEDRADIEFTIDREVSKLYKILTFGSAIGRIITETMTLPFKVEQS